MATISLPVNLFDSTYILDWVFNGDTPYLDALDGDTNSIYNNLNWSNRYVGWFHFANLEALSITSVILRIYGRASNLGSGLHLKFELSNGVDPMINHNICFDSDTYVFDDWDVSAYLNTVTKVNAAVLRAVTQAGTGVDVWVTFAELRLTYTPVPDVPYIEYNSGEIKELNHIIGTEFMEMKRVMLPEYINDPTPDIDTNVWNEGAFKITYMLRVDDANKWELDQILEGHVPVSLTDAFYGISGNAWLQKITAVYEKRINSAKPWRMTIEFIYIP